MVRISQARETEPQAVVKNVAQNHIFNKAVCLDLEPKNATQSKTNKT